VGGFALEVNASAGAIIYSTFRGDVLARPPETPYRTLATGGACKLITLAGWTSCPTACPATALCRPDGACVELTTGHDVGSIELLGLTKPIVIAPQLLSTSAHYEDAVNVVPDPRATPGTLITLRAAGAESPPFTLHGQTVAPLTEGAYPFPVVRDQPLWARWNPPAQPSASRVALSLKLGVVGGPDTIGDLDPNGDWNDFGTCDFPDNGQGTVPASLVNAILDRDRGPPPRPSCPCPA
jgi:hypothetical protein